MFPRPQKAKPETISDLLRKLSANIDGGEDVTIGQMLELFGVRGFAFLLFVFPLLNIAIFIVPGVSTFFGIPMIFFAVQMVAGLKTPVFPKVILGKAIKRSVLKRGLEIGINFMNKVEGVIRPRFLFLFGAKMDRVHGILAILLAVLMSFPFPFVNLPPSLGLVVLSLGIMQRDGLFIVGAYAIAFWSLWILQSLGHVAHMLVS